MAIKLNKVLQGKLNLFLETKDQKMNEFLRILGLNRFSFLEDEINSVEKSYKTDRTLKEYIYIYIGEAVIHVSGGWWTIDNLKRDEAYGLPVILGWGGKDDKPRICPDVWLKRIDTDRLRKPLGEMIYSL
jgi:hypothetical protein